MERVNSLEEFLAASDFTDYELSGHDNMIFLYAKNGLDTTGDMIQDLKIIIAYNTAMESRYVSHENIYHIVYGVFSRWVDKVEQYGFWHRLFELGHIFFEDNVSFKEVISSMISYISLIRMKYPHKELHFTKVNKRDLKDYIELL